MKEVRSLTVGTELDPEWKWDDKYPLAQIRQIGELLFISGQVPLNREGDLIGEGDVREQTRQVFKNIEELLGLYGRTIDNLFKVTAYLTDAALFKAYNDAREEVLKDHRPTSTTVVVSSLAMKGLVVEVDAIAWLNSSPRAIAPGKSA